MRRWIGLLAAIILPLLLFYGAWPAYSGWVIRGAIHANDAATLARKIDFQQVRASLRPLVHAEVQRSLDGMRTEGGFIKRALASSLKGSTLTRAVDAALDRAVTPENVLRSARYGKTLRQALRRSLDEEIGRVVGGVPGEERQSLTQRLLGRLLARKGGKSGEADENGDDEEPRAGPLREPRKYGLSNIRHLGLSGPVSLEVGVSRDPASRWSEVTARLAFTGWDWRVVGVIPSFER